MNSSLSLKYKKFNLDNYFVLFGLIYSVFCIYFIYIEKLFFSAIFFTLPVFIFAYIYFHKTSVFVLIAAIFAAPYIYWDLRIQLTELILVLLIVNFLINYKNLNFNDFKLPIPLKITTGLMFVSFFISALITPHFSFLSIYLTVLFYFFVFTSYYTMRSVLSTGLIVQYLMTFVYFVFLSGIYIVYQIFQTSFLRSIGLTGYAIMDFSVIALLILIFLKLLHDKFNYIDYILFFLILVILITTQSRFAWLGLALSSTYGIIITYFSFRKSDKLIKKKMIVLISFISLLMLLLVATGLGQILFARISQINFDFFQANNGDNLVSNSLESRLLIWITAYKAFLSNPIWGIGYQMFSEVSEYYNVLPQDLFDIYVKDLDAHTTFLNLLVETGIVGFTLFLSYIVTIFYYSVKAVKTASNMFSKKISILLNVLVFFIIVHSVYSGAFTFGQCAFVMHIIFGLTIANYLLIKSNKDILNSDVETSN